jgi:hypothetical protein
MKYLSQGIGEGTELLGGKPGPKGSKRFNPEAEAGPVNPRTAGCDQ